MCGFQFAKAVPSIPGVVNCAYVWSSHTTHQEGFPYAKWERIMGREKEKGKRGGQGTNHTRSPCDEDGEKGQRSPPSR